MPITSTIEIRRPQSGELCKVNDLVQTIVNDLYAGLWTDRPISVGESDWSRSWVACVDLTIVAVLLTDGDSLDDLWIVTQARRMGLGKRLLSLAEQEIQDRGFQVARLRVVSSNEPAMSFYLALGWRKTRQFTHELYPVQMTEMAKALHPYSRLIKPQKKA